VELFAGFLQTLFVICVFHYGIHFLHEHIMADFLVEDLANTTLDAFKVEILLHSIDQLVDIELLFGLLRIEFLHFLQVASSSFVHSRRNTLQQVLSTCIRHKYLEC